jgi:hypothetical protein
LSPKKTKRIFTIPGNDGPLGTPKTVKYLIDETKKRFKERHKLESNDISDLYRNGEQLFQRDPLKHILESDAVVTTINEP